MVTTQTLRVKVNRMPTLAQVERSDDHQHHRQVARVPQVDQVLEIETIAIKSQFKISADRRLNTIEGRGVAVQVGITLVVTQDPVRGIIVDKLCTEDETVRQAPSYSSLSHHFQGCFYNTMKFIQIKHETKNVYKVC